MNTLEYLLEKYPDKPWDWRSISDNPNITMGIIEKYPDKPWYLYTRTYWYWGISRNPNITMEIIEKNPDKPGAWEWNWYYISKHPNITIEDIEQYPNKPWNWKGICRNPNITIEFIEKYIDKINFDSLSSNKFTYQNKLNLRYYAMCTLEKVNNKLPWDLNVHIVKNYL